MGGTGNLQLMQVISVVAGALVLVRRRVYMDRSAKGKTSCGRSYDWVIDKYLWHFDIPVTRCQYEYVAYTPRSA